MKLKIALILLLAAVPGAACDTDAAGPDAQQQPDTTGTVPVTGPADITVDAAVRHQTIVGWEAHSQSGYTDPGFDSFSGHLFDLAVDDLGLTRLRIEPRSGIEHNRDLASERQTGKIDVATFRCLRFTTVNDNADPFSINWNGFQFSELDRVVREVILPVKQRIEANGERLFLTATYTSFIETSKDAGCPAGTQYHHDDSAAEYAEFVLAVHLHLRQEFGLVPDAWEVILEPDNTPFWRGRQIGEAIVAAANRLKQNGFTPRFIAPSTTHMGRAPDYIDAMMQVSGVQQYITEFSYHRYGGVTGANLQAIATRASQFDVQTSMLEHIGSGYEDLHEDLKVGQVSAWQQFALAFPTKDDGAQYYLIENSGGSSSVRMASRTRYLRQYFRYVRPGAVRVGATSRVASLDPLAFTHSTRGAVVVVKAEAAATFTVGGLPPGDYGTTFTTGSGSLVAGPDGTVTSSRHFQATIPAKGVITIFRK